MRSAIIDGMETVTPSVRAEMIRSHLVSHPGATRRQVYEALGLSRQRLHQLEHDFVITGFGDYRKSLPANPQRKCSNCSGSLNPKAKGDLCRKCLKLKPNIYPCSRCGKPRKRTMAKLCRECYTEDMKTKVGKVLDLTCARCGKSFQRQAIKDARYKGLRKQESKVACGVECALEIGRFSSSSA